MRYDQATEAWKRDEDVICHWCENHVDEEDAEVYEGDVMHDCCARSEKRQHELELDDPVLWENY